jgi:hypothetical protein
MPADEEIKVKRAPQNKNPFGKDAKKHRRQMSEISHQQYMMSDH